MKCKFCESTKLVINTRVCRQCYNRRTQESRKKRRSVKFSSAWFDVRYYSTKYKAKRRQISFELTKKEFIEIRGKESEPCPYCEKQMEKPSIDRLDNAKGYTKNNCVLACMRCNYLKSILTIEQIKNIYNLAVSKGLI